MLKTVATAVLSIVLHVLLGWMWTLGAGLVGGLWAGRHGWFVGGVAVGTGWTAAVVYSVVVAPASTRILLDTLAQLFGQMLGNIPDGLIVALTIFIGTLLGVLGGMLGTQLRGLIRREA
jgi:hypothetical protein